MLHHNVYTIVAKAQYTQTDNACTQTYATEHLRNRCDVLVLAFFKLTTCGLGIWLLFTKGTGAAISGRAALGKELAVVRFAVAVAEGPWAVAVLPSFFRYCSAR
ncbi:hypothetical protein ABBQ32_014053 [Trebouxia sp. C0010 RCD-2024]